MLLKIYTHIFLLCFCTDPCSCTAGARARSSPFLCGNSRAHNLRAWAVAVAFVQLCTPSVLAGPIWTKYTSPSQPSLKQRKEIAQDHFKACIQSQLCFCGKLMLPEAILEALIPYLSKEACPNPTLLKTTAALGAGLQFFKINKYFRSRGSGFRSAMPVLAGHY